MFTLRLAAGMLVMGHTANTMRNLANFFEIQRKYGKAQSLYERAFAISKRSVGLTHPDTQSLQQNVERIQRLHQRNKKKRQK